MSYVLTYDQIDENEESEQFETLDQAKKFAIENLNWSHENGGQYRIDMSEELFCEMLEKNGYFLNTLNEYEKLKAVMVDE